MIVMDHNHHRSIEGFDPAWAERDFVDRVRRYIHSDWQAALLISGLYGTGKTTGMYQLLQDEDALYLRAEPGERETAEDYFRLVDAADQPVIIIDEYPRIVGRERVHLDGIIDTWAHHGKKVILTGDDSAVLESLLLRDLMYRAKRLQVTRSSFSEFCRLYPICLPTEQDKAYEMFLKTGGMFGCYEVNTSAGLAKYVEKAFVDNLNSYIGGGALSAADIRAAVYTVLCDAVYDAMDLHMPRREFSEQARRKLAGMGIRYADKGVRPEFVYNVGDILAGIGALVKVPAREWGVPRDTYRMYTVNTSLTWQLLKVLYGSQLNQKQVLARLGSVDKIVASAWQEWTTRWRCDL